MATSLLGSKHCSSHLRHCSSRRCQPSSHARTAAAASTTPATRPAAAAAAPARSPAVGDVLDAVRCERLGDGVGVCFSEASGRLVLLVRGALPGELLSARVTSVKKGYCEAAKVATHSPHDNAATPACRHFGPCGGCSLQSLAYEAQLAHKADAVAQQFVRVARLSSELAARTMRPPLPASSSGRYSYRNKVQLAFSNRAWCQELGREQEVPAGVLGYYLPGSSSVVLPIQECSLMSPAMNQLAAAVLRAAQALQLRPFDPATGQGCLRHLIIRAAAAAGINAPTGAEATGTAATAAYAAPGQALMAVIVTTAAITSAELQPLADSLMQQCGSSLGLVSVVHSIEQQAAPARLGAAANSSSSSCDLDDVGSSSSSQDASNPPGPAGGSGKQQSTRRGNRHRRSSKQAATSSSRQPQRGARALAVASTSVLAGAPHLQEQLCGLQFLVSPHSFFQTNTQQAERLYGLVVAAVRDFYATAAAAAAGDPAPPAEHSSSSSSSSAGGGGNAADDASAVAPSPKEAVSGLVLDLYCGTGTISLALAGVCSQVLGFDISAAATADAAVSARRNGVTNVRFVCGDLTQLAARPGGLSQSAAGAGAELLPDVIVVDPARAGLSRSVVDFVLGSSARRLVYVSCNAATQARDLQLLCGSGGAAGAGHGSSGGKGLFELVLWTAVDMFPQTSHVETVVVLDRAAAAAAPQDAGLA